MLNLLRDCLQIVQIIVDYGADPDRSHLILIEDHLTGVILLGLLGGAELRRIHSYAFLLCGDPGDSWPAEEFRDVGRRPGGCPGKSGGLKPRVGPTAPCTLEAAGAPPAAAAAAAAA